MDDSDAAIAESWRILDNHYEHRFKHQLIARKLAAAPPRTHGGRRRPDPRSRSRVRRASASFENALAYGRQALSMRRVVTVRISPRTRNLSTWSTKGSTSTSTICSAWWYISDSRSDEYS